MQDIQLSTLTLDRELLNDLLTGALVAADKSKHAIAKLGSVYLSVKDNKLTATATDRYRLVSGSADVSAPDMDTMQLLVADVKRILALVKNNKLAREITLTRAGDSLSVAAQGDSLTIYLLGDTLPDIEQLLNKPSTDLSAISLNATYLGEFAKIPSSAKDSQINLEFTATDSGTPTQIKIKVLHDRIAWRCLLMPMRVSA